MNDDPQAKVPEIAQSQTPAEAARRLKETLLTRLESTPQKPVHMLLRRMLEAKSPTSPRPPPEAEEIASLRKLLRAASRELKALHERERQLALALGACGECWGHDVECARCKGAGAPGWAEPDAMLFARYVSPLLRRMEEPR